jgi:hypothetical protein
LVELLRPRFSIVSTSIFPLSGRGYFAGGFIRLAVGIAILVTRPRLGTRESHRERRTGLHQGTAPSVHRSSIGGEDGELSSVRALRSLGRGGAATSIFFIRWFDAVSTAAEGAKNRSGTYRSAHRRLLICTCSTCWWRPAVGSSAQPVFDSAAGIDPGTAQLFIA